MRRHGITSLDYSLHVILLERGLLFCWLSVCCVTICGRGFLFQLCLGGLEHDRLVEQLVIYI